jgi:hypothetical protein
VVGFFFWPPGRRTILSSAVRLHSEVRGGSLNLERGPLKLRVKIDYIPDEGRSVFHPSLGYLFLNADATRIVEKYGLDDGAGFDEIRSLVTEIDFRNGERPIDRLKSVRIIRTNNGLYKANVFDFANKTISEC